MIWWLVLLAAVFYALWPFDLLPDFLFPWGWLDDGLLLYILYRWLASRQAGSGPRSGRDADGGRPDSESARERDPYAVLGLMPGADPAEVRKAYRDLAMQYHPDRVAHLGEEFQELAERRFKEIQAAYHEISSRWEE